MRAMMKNKNILLRLVGILLCLTLVFSFVACNSNSDADDNEGDGEEDVLELEEETEPVETKRVVVFATQTSAGARINEYRVKLDDVPVTDLPIDPLTSIDDAIGKYLLSNGNIGYCVSASELSDTDPMISDNELGADYVLFSEIMLANSQIKDVSTLLQKAIDENPGKTIYIHDGRYNLTKPIIIPSDPAKSVSIRCSNYAVFSPANNSWDAKNTTLFQYGTPDSPKTQSGDHADYFMGGIFDGSGDLTAIEVYGGGRLLISNVAMKNVKVGIHIKPNGAYNIIENVNVTCPARSSKGIFVEGTNNSFTNMRIYHAYIGAHLTGGDNVLVNIHPLANPTSNVASAGFYDQSVGNRFSICYSDQYPVGFKMDSKTKSYFDMCFAFWWQNCANQIGFMCTGEFNSVISDSTVDVTKAESSSNVHFIYFIDESSNSSNSDSGWPPNSQINSATPRGEGVIINPILTGKFDSETHNQFLYNPN